METDYGITPDRFQHLFESLQSLQKAGWYFSESSVKGVDSCKKTIIIAPGRMITLRENRESNGRTSYFIFDGPDCNADSIGVLTTDGQVLFSKFEPKRDLKRFFEIEKIVIARLLPAPVLAPGQP